MPPFCTLLQLASPLFVLILLSGDQAVLSLTIQGSKFQPGSETVFYQSQWKPLRTVKVQNLLTRAFVYRTAIVLVVVFFLKNPPIGLDQVGVRQLVPVRREL